MATVYRTHNIYQRYMLHVISPILSFMLSVSWSMSQGRFHFDEVQLVIFSFMVHAYAVAKNFTSSLEIFSYVSF